MAKIDYDTPTNTNTNNTITERRHDPMLNNIKALTPGEWLHLATFAAVITIAYIVANNMY
jgi:GTP cyclohydrolase I